jgi:tetratricopeptide (TPR) repeat protein
MSSFCAQCGTTLKPDARFCEECGAVRPNSTIQSAPSLVHNAKSRSWLWIAAGAAAVLLVTGGLFVTLRDWFNPDARANKLFVEASQLMRAAQEAEQTSYVEAFKDYQAALANLEKVTTRYPSSQLAVQLTAGQTKIGPYTLAEFQEAVSKVQARADAEGSFLACALFIANHTKDASHKTRILRQVALAYAQAGQYNLALQTVNSIEDAREKASTLADITGQYARAGQYDEALRIANTMEHKSYKNIVLLGVVNAHAKAGHFDRALQIVNSLEDDPYYKSWALSIVAFEYAKAGRGNEALQIANTIPDDKWDFKPSTLAFIYAQTGEYDQALKEVDAVKDVRSKAVGLATIAAKLARAGDKEKSAELHSQALQIANTPQKNQPQTVVRLRTLALSGVMQAYVSAGDYDSALQIATYAQDDDKPMLFTDLLSAYISVDQWDRAVQVATMIGASTFSFPDNEYDINQVDEVRPYRGTTREKF